MSVVYGPGAEQNVDPTLINAVEEAAHELGVTLYVSSTTGGTHSKYSAHWLDEAKGWGHALDVSRIDGHKMANLTPARGGKVGVMISRHIPAHRLRELITPQFGLRFHRPVWSKETETRLVTAHRDHVHVSIVPIGDAT